MGILRNARMAYTGGKLATKLALPCAVAKKLSCYLPSFVYSNVPYQARYGLDVLGMLNPREWNDLIDMLLAELDPEKIEIGDIVYSFKIFPNEDRRRRVEEFRSVACGEEINRL